MKFLKHNWLILTILALVIAMVLIRSFNRNSFRYDAVRWAASSADGSNMVSTDRMAQFGEQALLISLGNMTALPVQFKEMTVMIAPGKILEKENIRLIRKNKGPVVLTSDDASVSARVWMVLSEMGIRNLYILSDQDGVTP